MTGWWGAGCGCVTGRGNVLFVTAKLLRWPFKEEADRGLASLPPRAGIRLAALFQHGFEEAPGMAAFHLGDFFRGAFGDDLTATVTALGTQIHDPVISFISTIRYSDPRDCSPSDPANGSILSASRPRSMIQRSANPPPQTQIR